MNDSKQNSHDEVPEIVKNAVLVNSSPIPVETPTVEGCVASSKYKKVKL